jgi:hypothetical protein
MGSEEPGTPGVAVAGKNKRQGMFKVIVDTIRDWFGEVAKLTGWERPERGF